MKTGLIALLLSFGFTTLLAPPLIKILQFVKAGQIVRNDGPQRHLGKAGTPTMGGLIFLLGLTLATLILGETSLLIFTLLGITWGYALLGWLDDMLKVVLRRPLGLLARQKLAGQVILGLVAGLVAMLYLGRGTEVPLPFSSLRWDLGWYYPALAAMVLVSTTNAVNLTDGLDGLAAGTTFIVALAYFILALALDKAELIIFAGALAGGCLGFLLYNFHPARVFMGDTGSLALGGAVGILSILTRTELILPILGAVYVLEALSVILQVLYFRLTGRRFLRMSPLHHHFELAGWPETKVVLFFWLLALFSSSLGLYSLTWK
ncbi:Phospho-N-acetylmuramoyl-pentapeptide-transferase [Thermanaeromonas toyohensis ToBE]|uniref:Phospho-N-acetylmuramoyl-pentapeptide-transferase n=1 Tax=Thermanaeromonas toyohensis ToBE TaxID=698762 RepID=A0A1W1VMP7_9FIRM|nr:phospho-N-acetylmuramoyl-pentapeptide-transferase [Thermanaeromonas toyohensis]SMB94321.1 Phospho-N-acetylmuramoyl-pentapeptide-transferase [Thermanaeromonas toyohensis ToBE]